MDTFSLISAGLDLNREFREYKAEGVKVMTDRIEHSLIMQIMNVTFFIVTSLCTDVHKNLPQ